ncbi:hypothetical protein VKT23_008537 [Stygiomarasmius scandens]|uniref:Glycoside hydrolase family 31 protein n=1 Tax=Marasmiellus scandens TaxID=2682957 RepID=A0ABR1JGQ3_9AGAR
MKFNDGFWLVKSGVKPYFAFQAVSVSQEADSYNLRVATRPIRHRGDTLGGPVLSARIHSPTQGVIGVKIDHFKWEEDVEPKIALFPDAHAPAVPDAKLSEQVKAEGGKEEKVYQLSTGRLTATITQNPYTVTFTETPAAGSTNAEPRILTFAGSKYTGIYDVPFKWTLSSASNSSCLTNDFSSNPAGLTAGQLDKMVRYLNTELNLSPGELVYGFGEQFGAFVKNGQVMRVWNQDGGTSSDQAYKCVPFYITNRNYGVFINHPGEVEVEVGSEKVSRVGMSVSSTPGTGAGGGAGLEYFIIHGETPLEILERYTRLTGRPALLPAWTFGLWLSTSFLTSYDSKTVSGFLQGMEERACNVRVFHLDCFWMKGYEWCSFTFDPDNFPDPAAYLQSIKEKYGVKICVWINPYISQLSPIFFEGAKNGYFIKRPDGTPWQWDLWQPGLAIVDFTNPGACKWYREKLERLMDLGVDCFKTDFGERIPHANVVYHSGADPIRMHNAYATIYNQLVFEILEERRGKGEAVLFARTAHAGGQRFPVHWGGDCESTWEAMAEAIRGALSLTTSGFAFASHDIGGFEGHPPPEIYQRWVAFGLFSTHSRLHGSSSYRVPWNYGEEAAKNMATLVRAKHELMPYLYDQALISHHYGYPSLRTMFIQFPTDPTTHTLSLQYMLGPSLLVAPVFVPVTEETTYYLPKGKWTYYWDFNRTITAGNSDAEGGVWVKEKVPINEIPVWIREGTVLVRGSVATGLKKPDYEYHKGMRVDVFFPAEGQEIVFNVPVVDQQGGKEGRKDAAVIRAVKKEGKVTVGIVDGVAEASLETVGLWTGGSDQVKAANGGNLEGGNVVRVGEGVKEVVFDL